MFLLTQTSIIFLIDVLSINPCNKLHIKSRIQMRGKSLNCAKTDRISLSLLELQGGGEATRALEGDIVLLVSVAAGHSQLEREGSTCSRTRQHALMDPLSCM